MLNLVVCSQWAICISLNSVIVLVARRLSASLWMLISRTLVLTAIVAHSRIICVRVSVVLIGLSLRLTVLTLWSFWSTAWANQKRACLWNLNMWCLLVSNKVRVVVHVSRLLYYVHIILLARRHLSLLKCRACSLLFLDILLAVLLVSGLFNCVWPWVGLLLAFDFKVVSANVDSCLVSHARIGLNSNIHFVWSQLTILVKLIVVCEAFTILTVETVLKLVSLDMVLNQSAILFLEFTWHICIFETGSVSIVWKLDSVRCVSLNWIRCNMLLEAISNSSITVHQIEVCWVDTHSTFCGVCNLICMMRLLEYSLPAMSNCKKINKLVLNKD